MNELELERWLEQRGLGAPSPTGSRLTAKEKERIANLLSRYSSGGAASSSSVGAPTSFLPPSTSASASSAAPAPLQLRDTFRAGAGVHTPVAYELTTSNGYFTTAQNQISHTSLIPSAAASTASAAGGGGSNGVGAAAAKNGRDMSDNESVQSFVSGMKTTSANE